jgi:hypothetical protein
MSVRVPLTLACWDYGRTEPLRDGRIRPDGIDLTYLSLPVEETFFRMARYREFDEAEMSLSSYVLTLFQDAPFIAIPTCPRAWTSHRSRRTARSRRCSRAGRSTRSTPAHTPAVRRGRPPGTAAVRRPASAVPHEQGLAGRVLSPAELFAPETLESFVI